MTRNRIRTPITTPSRILSTALIVLASGLQIRPPSRNWLRDANDEPERLRRIELWAGAGDLEMQDIAHRLEELHGAIQRENWDMGVYQPDAEKVGFVNGSAVFERLASFPTPTR